MAILVKAPELPATGGIVTWWEKELGEEIQFGDTLVEIRAGTVDYLVKAVLPGTILHIFVPTGREVNTDAPMALVGEKSEDITQWITQLAGSDSSKTAAEVSFQSSFSTTTPAAEPTAVQDSGFSVSPDKTASSKPHWAFPEGMLPAVEAAPQTLASDSGSSFTTAEPTPVASFSSNSHLTSEQAQNLASYGKGFDRFIKMRPIPQQGAMGELFFATQAISGREVVIKRIKPERRTDSKSMEYFIREINLGTALPYHRNIINILYSDENEYGPYYVMERVNGHSLQYMLDNQLLPADKIKDTFTGILEGMRHIHTQLMVHRDLKPMNILLDTQHWIAKIIDFGFAKHPAYPDIDVFNMGTPGYMAPEQQGNQQQVSFQADIYAIGCVLYTILTREHPQTMEVEKIENPVFRDIIVRCTKPEPAERYQSVQEIITILTQKPTVSDFSVKKEAPASSIHFENFKTLVNEWVLEALPAGQPLTSITRKLLQKQAENAGLNPDKTATELQDFTELYREIRTSGETTSFGRRSLLVQGASVYITEATIDKLLASAVAIQPNTDTPVPSPPSVQAVVEKVVENSVSSPVDTPKPVPTEIVSTMHTPVMQKTMYARAAGLFDEFEADKLTETLQADSLYEIRMENANMGSFIIATNAAAMEAALQNKRFFLHPACVLVEIEPVLRQKIYTLEPGRLERSGVSWKIIEKAKIRIG